MRITRLIRAITCFVSVGVLARCGSPNASTSPPAPALSSPTRITPDRATWYATLTTRPTHLPTPTWMPPPTEDATTVALEETAYVIEEQTRIPPTSAVPLAAAIKHFGRHALLHTTPDNFLTLYDLDTSTSLWL